MEIVHKLLYNIDITMKINKVTKTRKKTRSKYILLAIAVLVAISIVLFALEAIGVTNFYQKTSDTNSEVNKVNYNPPTEDERKTGDKQKEETVQEEANRNSPPEQNKSSANVVISDAAQYENVVEVRSYVSNHYEDGTCTFKLVQGGQVVEKTTQAYRDVSTTICNNPLFNRSQFPSPGNWQITVTYSSAGAQGISEPKTVTIR